MAPDHQHTSSEISRPRITVAGAGVIGLSCAVRLAEAGYAVDVLARDLPLETTSAVAGGLWMPFLAEPADLVNAWARSTFEEMRDLSEVSGSGVAMRTGYLVGDRPKPSWAGAVADLAPLTAVQDPVPGQARGWQATVPMVDMPAYLTYLVRRLRAADGTLTRLSLPALPAHGLVVNCTGLAARGLASDPSVHPVRGQVLTLTNPGLTNWWTPSDHTLAAPTYVLAHPGRVVVGGTVEPDQWSTTPDLEVSREILRRAREWVPELASATVLSHRAALRPARPRVRLETVAGPQATVVHCYGHGGSGITISWGCASDVLIEVESLGANLRPTAGTSQR
jgi:D-amino-acid oxidase